MRLVTYSMNQETRLGALLDQQMVDVQRAYEKLCHAQGIDNAFGHHLGSMMSLLSAGDRALLAAAEVIEFVRTAASDGKESLGEILLDLSQVRLLAPLLNPGKILCIGGNFPAAGKLAAPEFPIVFLKPSSGITGPGMPICVPALATNVAYEVELVVVIGKRARHVSKEQAPRHIAGYTMANDLGDRVLEKRTSQWTSGKMFDSFTPLGPAIVTPDELRDPRTLGMQTWVNAQPVQKGCTAEMFFDVDSLISYLSSLTTLEPGDIILTGSPKLMDGQPAPSVALKPGDTVRIALEGVGELVNPVQAEPGE